MSQVWCAECAKDKQPGTRKVLERSAWGEPAEFERVLKGRARKPQAEQRVMFFNGEPIPLAQGHYDCDNCGAPIRPGDPAMTWTVWTEMMTEPAEWESQFLELIHER